MKPIATILAFEPDKSPPPPSPAMDELVRRWREILVLPPKAREIVIKEIWAQFDGVGHVRTNAGNGQR